ncbi:sigma-E processing peptidase SpoIIGA [Brevibacillus humidisoli]|uniref:sigma-E processing peptidase SpoIIGA n=1 Tax=Brevibacillus humidisoli TaxID=2895522 RepID=UPI001E3D69C0|nr:sigma-E processing peptidase SpoIIGA [Brevibacillus humidisoli]UFJ41934.1 sigma-E processing peptidase SpoIIGA [Brevibacillus humidisoli]
MVVYLDIIILLNFAIDTLLLWFTAYFRKARIVWWRLLAAAAFGSTYIAFFFLPSFAGMYQWMVKLLFSVLMLLIAFGFPRLLAFAHHLCVFYFVAFVFGGGVFGLNYLLASQSEVMNGILVTHNDGFGVGSKPTLLVLAAGFALVYILSRNSYRAIQGPRQIESFLVEVCVKVNGESVICRGLVDTGNQLQEPITRIPVMIMESKLLAHLLPAGLSDRLAQLNGMLDGLDDLFDSMRDEWQARLRVIPYRSVSRGMDFLLAVKPDVVVIVQQGERFECRRVLLGLNPHPLSADQTYQAIVHPALVQQDPEGTAKSIKQEG